MLTIKDLNLLRSNTYYLDNSWKASVIRIFKNPLTVFTSSAHTEYFLKNINLTIGSSERIALLGKNGSGKSTLARILAGQINLTSGDINNSFKTNLFSNLESCFFKELSGRENIRFFLNFIYSELSHLELAHLRRQAEEFSELGPALDRQCETYSTGMLTRIALSIILARPHNLLILDELQSHADLSFRNKIQSRLKQVIDNSTTVILISHDMEEVVSFCSRGLVLDDGNLAFDGPISKAITAYKMLAGFENE